MQKYTVTPLKFDQKLVEKVIRRRADGESLGTIAKALKTTPGKVAMAELVGTTPRQAIDDPAKLARAVAKDRKAGAAWGLLAARYGVTEGTARAAYTAATGQPHSSLDFRKAKAIVAAVLALLLLPAMASASTPSAAQLAWAQSKAVAYWHVPPPCGQPRIVLSATTTDIANANPATCTITFSTTQDWEPAFLCLVYVHEFGHLVLGVNYFATTNPEDPAHSPDHNSVMFGGIRTSPFELEPVERRAGCLPPLVRRHKSHKARKSGGR